jgi:hypothetical protein
MKSGRFQPVSSAADRAVDSPSWCLIIDGVFPRSSTTDLQRWSGRQLGDRGGGWAHTLPIYPILPSVPRLSNPVEPEFDVRLGPSCIRKFVSDSGPESTDTAWACGQMGLPAWAFAGRAISVLRLAELAVARALVRVAAAVQLGSHGQTPVPLLHFPPFGPVSLPHSAAPFRKNESRGCPALGALRIRLLKAHGLNGTFRCVVFA